MSIIKTVEQERVDRVLDSVFSWIRFVLAMLGVVFILGWSWDYIHFGERIVNVYTDCHLEQDSSVNDLMRGEYTPIEICETYDCTQGK